MIAEARLYRCAAGYLIVHETRQGFQRPCPRPGTEPWEIAGLAAGLGIIRFCRRHSDVIAALLDVQPRQGIDSGNT